MAMVAGILAIVAAILKPITDGIGNCIAEPIKDRFKYLCCFTDNVKDLEKEAPKLESIRCEVQERVNRAQNNAEIVVARVQTWLNDVSEIQTGKLKIDSEITTTINGGCSIVRCRYSVSKRVKKMVEAMKELGQESDKFKTIAHPPPPAAMVPINLRSTTEFDSRKSVEEEVMSSLRDERTHMVGICGMGGVGKTTMAKTIMHRAKEELEFKETVMTVFSHDVDKMKIQRHIAKSLGLTLSAEGSLSSNAHELRTRLSGGTRKTLVVIDDVWKKLDFEELGIPCSNTCKVLITSRNSRILVEIGVKKPHAVDVLSKTEAWELFKSKAWSCNEQPNVVDVARQVVDECKGLPLALVTVGVALKNEVSTDCWKTVLQQLKSANPRHMPELITDVYQPLRLSYEKLETEEIKSLLLLCCLFPEDYDIHVETLANISMGLNMYQDITSLEQARYTTCFLVKRLKSSFLLLEGKDEDHVKMHDVVRDVAIFIAAEEKRIKCNERTWISPNIGERIRAHEESSPSPNFPNLRLLWIDRESRDKELEIHNDFFCGMKELKVIMMKCRSLQRLPETIGLLKNLRTLVLEDCESLECISVVGKLVNLEILICRFCRRIESLPAEIENLRKLKLLELSQCWKLKTIVPGIISNLIELEELIVDSYFDGWEARIVEGERRNAPLCELEHLSKLTRLKIGIRNNGLAAESFNLLPNLLKFHITFGNFMNDMMSSSLEKKMKLEMSADISWGNFLKECVGNVEHMYIKGDGSSVLGLQLAPNLRRLEISECSKVKKLVINCPLLEHLYLVKVSELEEICMDIQHNHGLEEVSELEEIRVNIQHNLASSFNNLSSITIGRCGWLRILFSSSIMGSGDCFPQLERLKIYDCEMMVQVFMWNDEKEDQTNIPIPLLFPKLNFIYLEGLPNLTCFIKGMQSIEFPQLGHLHIEYCPALKEFVYSGPSAHHQGVDNDYLHLSCDPYKVTFGNLSKLHIDGARKFCLQAPNDSFAGLSELEVSGLKGVNRLFLFSMTESNCLPQLEKLKISNCDTMKEVITWKEEEEENQMDRHITLFPNLKNLSLSYLPRLTSLNKGIQNIEFHVPPKMYIDNCPLLESCASEIADTHLFCNQHHKVEFDRLKELVISGSWEKKMRTNWCPQIPMIDLFRGVCMLSVSSLKGMESLFPCSIAQAQMMPNIKNLKIHWCEEMVRVIEDKVDASETTTPILLFPKLESLSLCELHKLCSFCEWRCGLQLPSLLNLTIKECNMMVELTSGPLYTPKLQKIQKDNHKFNGKDVSSPWQLSSLPEIAKKNHQEKRKRKYCSDEASSSRQRRQRRTQK